MANKTNIFILGSTGYIGGNILDRLLRDPRASESFDITALVRSREKGEKLKTFGVNVVQGDHNDAPLVERLVSAADVVISAADSDALDAAKAVAAGLKARHLKTGKVPILIHLSGTGVLEDGARGMYSSDKIYYDNVPEDIESLPETQIHRDVDLVLEKADREGYAKTYIILPAFVFGIVDNQLTKAGIQSGVNSLMKLFVSIALKRGAAAYVGEGRAILGTVQVDELVDLVILVFNAALAGDESAGHGREGYYFGSEGEFKHRDFQTAIGEALAEAWKIPASPVASSFTTDELVPLGRAGDVFGANCRAESVRSKALGWKPRATMDDFYSSVRESVAKVLEESS